MAGGADAPGRSAAADVGTREHAALFVAARLDDFDQVIHHEAGLDEAQDANHNDDTTRR